MRARRGRLIVLQPKGHMPRIQNSTPMTGSHIVAITPHPKGGYLPVNANRRVKCSSSIILPAGKNNSQVQKDASNDIANPRASPLNRPATIHPPAMDCWCNSEPEAILPLSSWALTRTASEPKIRATSTPATSPPTVLPITTRAAIIMSAFYPPSPTLPQSPPAPTYQPLPGSRPQAPRPHPPSQCAPAPMRRDLAQLASRRGEEHA